MIGAMGRSFVHVPIFEFGAAIYDVLTRQGLWREQIAAVLRYLPAAAWARERLRVLDLGCGPGISSFVLAERLGARAEVVGIDIARNMIARARRHHAERYRQLHGVRFEVADATRLRFADARFDLAVGHSFLYLVPDRAAVLAEVRRVLAPGGTLVLMEPHRHGSLLGAAWAARTRVDALWRRPWAATRFVTSMALWRLVSAAAGRLDEPRARVLFERAGFDRLEVHPTLGGLGLHLVGRVDGQPQPERPERRGA